MVKVDTVSGDAVAWWWDMEKFKNRLYLMREMYEEYIYGDRSLSALSFYTQDKDPFYDPPANQLIGKALVFLQGLNYFIDIEEAVPIIDYKGAEKGELLLHLIPQKCGGKLCQVDDFFDDNGEQQLEDHLGEDLELTVKVISARGLPYNTSCNVSVFEEGVGGWGEGR